LARHLCARGSKHFHVADRELVGVKEYFSLIHH
jgi:hypothetical protein